MHSSYKRLNRVKAFWTLVQRWNFSVGKKQRQADIEWNVTSTLKDELISEKSYCSMKTSKAPDISPRAFHQSNSYYYSRTPRDLEAIPNIALYYISCLSHPTKAAVSHIQTSSAWKSDCCVREVYFQANGSNSVAFGIQLHKTTLEERERNVHWVCLIWKWPQSCY